MEYCSNIWGATAPSKLKILDAIQRRAVRLVDDPRLTGRQINLAEVWKERHTCILWLASFLPIGDRRSLVKLFQGSLDYGISFVPMPFSLVRTYSPLNPTLTDWAWLPPHCGNHGRICLPSCWARIIDGPGSLPLDGIKLVLGLGLGGLSDKKRKSGFYKLRYPKFYIGQKMLKNNSWT